MPLRFVSAAFLAIVALAVAECAQIVGVLLVFTLMVGPAAAAMNLTRRLALAVALSAGARARRSLGRTDARLLHRLADQLLDHRALWHGVLRRGGGAALRGLNRVWRWGSGPQSWRRMRPGAPRSAEYCEAN